MHSLARAAIALGLGFGGIALAHQRAVPPVAPAAAATAAKPAATVPLRQMVFRTASINTTPEMRDVRKP